MTRLHVEGPRSSSAPRRRLRTPQASHQQRGFRARAEQGSSSESVIVVPAVLVIMFLIVQVGIWAYAQSIAQHAAQEGATAEALYQSSQSSTGTAQGFLADSASGVLTDYTVTSSRTADTVTVTVRGRALSLVPLYDLPAVEQTVTVPIEHYVP